MTHTENSYHIVLILRMYPSIYVYLNMVFISEGEGEIETLMRNPHWSAAFCMPLTGDSAGNPGMCPDGDLTMTFWFIR